MAARFNLQQLGRTKVNRNLAKEISTRQFSSLSRNRFLRLITRYDVKLWLSFYFALISTCIFTAVIIDQTGIATKIMNRVRLNQRLALSVSPPLPDHSSLSINTDANLVALITFPSGRRVGEDANYVRFLEVPNVTMSIATPASQSGRLWSIYARNLETGIYIIDFSLQATGEYRFILNLYHIDGINRTQFTHLISGQKDQLYRYLLSYDKNSPLNTTLEYQESLNLY